MSEFRQAKTANNLIDRDKNSPYCLFGLLIKNKTSLQVFMLQTRTDAKSGPCQRCRIIRSFIMFTFMLVILAIVGGKRLEVINFLTPAWFATAIIALGLCGLLIKLVSWKLFNKII
jgi:hypothetical protein